LDQTLVAGRGCPFGWRLDDVSGGIHQGGRVQIRHVFVIFVHSAMNSKLLC